jgi:hypothetical protein
MSIEKLASLSLPAALNAAQCRARDAQFEAADFARLNPDDEDMNHALALAATAARRIADLVAVRVNARRVVREEREAELRANPYRFVINHKAGGQTKGGAKSKALAIDHLRKIADDEPGSVCFYTGRNGNMERPQRIHNTGRHARAVARAAVRGGEA